MKEYAIRRAQRSVPLDESVEGAPWAEADTFDVAEFSWYEGGPKPATRGRMLYDDSTLYLRFDVEDAHITAEVTDLNGPTYRDSSVEFFADPDPNSKYFNFEANCCGQFKLAWQEPGWAERGIGRDLIAPELADRIVVETSVPGPTKRADPTDEGWWLAAAIPFDVLAEFTGLDVEPSTGTEWRGNFYRSGVESDSQKATWNPIPKPEPDYHSPECFGRLRFA